MKFRDLLETSKVISKPDEVKDFEVFARVRDAVSRSDWIYIIKDGEFWVASKFSSNSKSNVFMSNLQPSKNPKQILFSVSKQWKLPEIEYIS